MTRGRWLVLALGVLLLTGLLVFAAMLSTNQNSNGGQSGSDPKVSTSHTQVSKPKVSVSSEQPTPFSVPSAGAPTATDIPPGEAPLPPNAAHPEGPSEG